MVCKVDDCSIHKLILLPLGIPCILHHLHRTFENYYLRWNNVLVLLDNNLYFHVLFLQRKEVSDLGIELYLQDNFLEQFFYIVHNDPYMTLLHRDHFCKNHIHYNWQKMMIQTKVETDHKMHNVAFLVLSADRVAVV